MAWSVSLRKEPVRSSGALEVTLVYTDGSREVTEEVRIGAATDAEALAGQAQQTITRLTAIDLQYAALVEGPLLAKAPSVPALTPAQAYQQDYLTYLQLRKLVDLGILDAANADLAAVTTRVKDNFLVDYVPLLTATRI